jgi:hypothetical protein
MYNMGMNITMSQHAVNRIQNRLGNLTSRDEVISSVSCRIREKRTWVLIRKIAYTEIHDSDVKPDGIARGNMIIALVDTGIIETVVIRKSESQSAEFRKILH